MKKITLLMAVFAVSYGFAQNNNTNNVIQDQSVSDIPSTRTCGTMDGISPQELANFEEALAPHVAQYLQNVKDGGNPEQVYYVPTVVHVIHNSNEAVGVGSNIPNLRVHEQITTLNEDFRRLNADAVNTPTYFSGVAANCEINFCLITKYPTGHPQAGQVMPEKGINRVDATTVPGLGNAPGTGYTSGTINNLVKFYHNWNQDEVFNIWVLRLQSGLLGYATFPNTTAAYLDGVVIGYQYFGNTGSAPYNKGRTTTHEVGHWLGLYHIWGDDFGACSGSDQVSDTPNQGNSTGGCPSGVRTDNCTGGTGIMYQNFMDYTNDACMNLFTEGQKARVQSVMATQPRRNTLNAFSICAPTGIEDNMEEHDVEVFPNPSTGIVNVVFPAIISATITVHNMIGEVIYENKNMSTSDKIAIDMSNQPNGSYFVKVRTETKLITKKITLVK